MTKVSELIKKSMFLLGRFDAAEAYGGDAADDEQNILVKALLYCFNAVADELVRHYFPVETEETFENAEGVVYFTEFSKAVRDVLAVENADGKPVPYKRFYDRVECDTRNITIKYGALHSARTEDDDSGLDDRTGDNLVTYGMAAEYCLINGECALAELWENRYRCELDRSLADLPAHKAIPPRRWI